MVLLFQLDFALSGQELAGQDHTLADLRLHVSQLQSDRLELETERTDRLVEFSRINDRIFQLQQTEDIHTQPLIQIQLRSELKASRDLANRIADIDRAIYSNTKDLQIAYGSITSLLEVKIEEALLEGKTNSSDSKDLNLLQDLNKERRHFLALMATVQVEVDEWIAIEAEDGDSIERLELKKILLFDKQAKLDESIKQLLKRKLSYEQDMQVNEELLEFYIEINRSLEDEMDIFDRNRIEEIRYDIGMISRTLEENDTVLTEHMVNKLLIKEKIEQFDREINERNKQFQNAQED